MTHLPALLATSTCVERRVDDTSPHAPLLATSPRRYTFACVYRYYATFHKLGTSLYLHYKELYNQIFFSDILYIFLDVCLDTIDYPARASGLPKSAALMYVPFGNKAE
jgi:hypothetical protein